jgi:hypothetical protein
MFHICGVSKTFGEWYQETNKTEDTNKLTLLTFKIIAILHNTRLATFILHNTRLATFIKLLETVSNGTFLYCRRTAAIQQRVTAVLLSIPKEAFAESFQKLYERCQPCVVKDGDYFEGQ